MGNILLETKVHEDLRDFKLKESLKSSKEMTFSDAVKTLLGRVDGVQ